MAVRELSPARCTSASPLVLARRTKLFALSEMRWAALALGLFSAGLLTQLCGAPQWVRWALFLACYATGGWEPGLAGLQALQRRTLDVDLLMVVAAIGAAAIGQIAERSAHCHLRNLRCSGSTGNGPHRGLGAWANGPRAGHRDPRGRRRW